MNDAKRLKLAKLEIQTLRAQNEQLKRAEKMLQDQLEAYREMIMGGGSEAGATSTPTDDENGETPGKQSANVEQQLQEKEEHVKSLEAKLQATQTQMTKLRSESMEEKTKLEEQILHLKNKQVDDEEKISYLQSIVNKAKQDGVMHRAMQEMVLSSQSKLEAMQAKLDNFQSKNRTDSKTSDGSDRASSTDGDIQKALERLADLPLTSDLEDNDEEYASKSFIPAGNIRKSTTPRSRPSSSRSHINSISTPVSRPTSARGSLEAKTRMQIRSAENISRVKSDVGLSRIGKPGSASKTRRSPSYRRKSNDTTRPSSRGSQPQSRLSPAHPLSPKNLMKMSSTWGAGEPRSTPSPKMPTSRRRRASPRNKKASKSDSKKKSKYREFMAQAKLLSDKKKN